MKHIFTKYDLLRSLLFLSFLIEATGLRSQTFIQITTGTPGTPQHNAGPIYRSSASSAYDASRYAYLYTSDEFSTVGISNGDLITDIGWVKDNAVTTTGGGIFRIYMKNSAASTYSGANETWANLTSGATLVYENLNQNIPATANPNYIMFALSSPFLYTGGSVEIFTEWDINQVTGNPTTGTFGWMWSTVVNRIYGTGQTSLANAGTLSSTTNSINTIDDRRPFIQLGFIPGVNCSGIPNGGIVSSSQSSVCPGLPVSLTVSGSTLGGGLSYQWQSSPDGFVWTDLPGQSGASASIVINTPLNFRRRIICNAGPDTSYSNSVSVGVNNFLNCYCGVLFPSGVEPITLVQFSSINNATSGTVGGSPALEDFSSITGDVVKGLTYPITVNGNTDGNFTNLISVYIDWNQNGLFTDVGEDYQIGSIVNCANCGVTGSVQIPTNALTGATKMRVIKKFNTIAGPCNTAGFGQAEDYTLNVLPPPADEAGVLAITQPEIAACNLGNQLWVNVQNLGTSDLVSAVFNVAVNGFNLPAANWTGLVPAQSTSEVQVPVTYSFADGDSISVTVSQPNGQTENPLFNFNNQKGRRVFAGLSGIKTVYGTGSDYSDIDAAVSALVQRGACDTVYFKIASGNYATQHVFLPYPGSGPGNLAVFEAASGDAADAVFAFNATTDPGNYVFRFDGADGYMLRNVTAINQGTAFSRVIDIRNGADFITLEDNVLIGDTAAAYLNSDFNRVVIASVNASNDMNTVVRNNLIMGGNRGANLGGATGNYEEGLLVEGNTFEKYGHIGIIIGNQNAAVIRNNTFRPRTNQTQEVFGVYANGTIGGGIIEANDYLSFRIGSAIFLNNTKGSSSPVLVRNNFLYMGDSLATGVSRGVLVQEVNSADIAIVNNSIAFYSDNANSGAITVIDGSEIQIWNNNIGAFGTAPAVRIEKEYSISASDNNNYFGTSLMWSLGNVYTTLANLQTATGNDGSSVSANPGFTGTDLHTCASELNGAAVSVPFVTSDFDGDPRSTTPDIGADEFVGDAGDLVAQDEFLKCPSETVTLGNGPLDGVTYSWTPSGNTSEISVTAAGTYVVTATSACGSFSDTVVVTNKPLPTANFTVVSVGLAAIFTNNSTGGTSYLWDFGDGATSTEVNPTHVYSSAATYSATLTVTNDCGSQIFGPLPVNVINASIEENVASSISLFPNPTLGMFTLSLGASASSDMTVAVSDITGKVVLNGQIATGSNQVMLDASTLPSGIYSVKITGGEISQVLRLIRK